MAMVLDARGHRLKEGDVIIWQAHNIECEVVGFEDVIVPTSRDQARNLILRAKIPLKQGITTIGNIFVVPKDDVPEGFVPVDGPKLVGG